MLAAVTDEAVTGQAVTDRGAPRDRAVERRERPRLPVETPVLVIALDGAGLSAASGSMLDVSGGGARIELSGDATFERGVELLLVDVVDGRQRLVRVVHSRGAAVHLAFAENEAAAGQ